MTNNFMRYAVYLTRTRSSNRNPDTAPLKLNPSDKPVAGLEASSLTELLDKFSDWLGEYQPKSNDGFDIRVRALKPGTDEWLRDDWTAATPTIEFRQFQSGVSYFRKLDPVALAWAAGDDGAEVSK
jgi:hypothetical protein